MAAKQKSKPAPTEEERQRSKIQAREDWKPVKWKVKQDNKGRPLIEYVPMSYHKIDEDAVNAALNDKEHPEKRGFISGIDILPD